MLKRHNDQILSRLDELYANGITNISFGELYHWYDIQKIQKKPWRDIKSKWEEILQSKGVDYKDPLIADTPSGVALFFSSSPMTLSEKAE